ncbi:MAG: methyl-accepting chemotaxis protein [Spirochaetales bacterium]|nr:methyl-accepting chemotaxis protein [Spirochaetales bacterium]
MRDQNHKRKISFATPLILLIWGVLAIALIFQNVFVTAITEKEIDKNQRDNFLAIAQSIHDLVEKEIESNEQILQGYSKSLAYIFSQAEPDHWAIENIIETISFSNPLFESVFICDGEGIITFSNDDSVLGADISGRDYFMALVDGFETTYTTPTTIVSKATGNHTIVHGVTLVKDGTNYGLLGVSLNLDLFGQEQILSKSVGETGYPFVLDMKGQFIVHPNGDFVFQKASDLIPSLNGVIKSKESVETHNYTYNNEKRMGIFIKIDRIRWTVGLSISEKEAYRASRVLEWILIATSTALLLLVGLIVLLFTRMNLIGKIGKLEGLIIKASRGDLREHGLLQGRDEIAEMSGYLNSFIDSLSGFFCKLGDSLEDLEDVGNELSSNMEETAAAVYQIKTNVESSLGQIENQEKSVTSTVTTVEEISRNIEALDRNIEIQNENIEQGSAAVEEMVAQFKNVSDSTGNAEKLMETLESSSLAGRNNLREVSARVQNILEKSHNLEEANALISGIAARTNLLAMNAAIEAAHAGEAGRGFSVVADEIRKLAEQSTMQSGKVRETISDIGESISDVVEESRISNNSFEEVLENIQGMSRITNEIRASMEEQVSGSSEVLHSLEQIKNVGREVKSGSGEMTEGNRIILESVERLTQISHEVAQAMQEIESGMNEINRSVEAVTDLSQKNRASIEVVRVEAAQYKTDKDSPSVLPEQEFIPEELQSP